MRFKLATGICLATALLVASCAPDQPASKTSNVPLQATVVSKGKSTTADPMPTIPANAQYTLFCQIYTGADHVVRAQQVRDILRQSTTMKDWYIVHGNDQSTLYYGFYRTVDPRDPNDAGEGKRAINDLNSIRSIVDSTGIRPFSTSLPELIDSPDPSANPAWDLTRTSGFWSLEVGVYYGSPERKKFAVDMVREARARGVEAYYFHGPTSSSVCIGCWPKEAALETDPSMQNDDPNQSLFVTAQPMPDEVTANYSHQGIKTVAPKISIVDPTLLDAMRRYPDHATNGEIKTTKGVDPATGAPTLKNEASVLVKVPHHDPADDIAGAPTEAPTGPAMPAGPEPGIGPLKSIGE